MRAGFRPDIQGLRAVAVITVLLFHSGWSFFGGGFVGVDVFFVISGFLITGILLREAESTGRIRLGNFYARRARRILPAATVVLLATLVLTVVFLPQIRWESVGVEAIASAVYVVNWVFAAGTDYLNADVPASPLQHFWTLAVEEQYYILWPLILILLLMAIGLKKRDNANSDHRATTKWAARIGVLLILIPSLLWSIYYTAVMPEASYFITTTRLWEIAIGAAVAVFSPQLERMPSWVGHSLGWLGLLAITATTLLFTGSTPFPSFTALLPTLGAAAIIAGGMDGRAEKGVGRVLTLKPMRWLGDISYSLYLWHWPLIVVGTYLLGGELRVRYGLLIVAIAVIPAWLSYKLIEKPFQAWNLVKLSVRRSLLVGLCMMSVTAVCASLVYLVPERLNPEYHAGSADKVGAEALTDDFANDDLASFTDAGKPVDVVEGGFTPSAINARDDNTVVYQLRCHLGTPRSTPKIKGCVFGDPKGDVSVVLIGDSHAANWSSAFIALAEEHGWRLRITTKASCGFSHLSQASRDGSEYTTCNEWSAASFDRILKESPDLVVTANRFTRSTWEEGLTGYEARLRYADGLRDNLQSLNDAGIPTLVMSSTPSMEQDPPECISANPEHLTECATPRETAFPGTEYVERAVAGLPTADIIDMSNWICPDPNACAAVIGNVVVWRDTGHFTETFARTLAKPLEAKLRQSDLARNVLW